MAAGSLRHSVPSVMALLCATACGSSDSGGSNAMGGSGGVHADGGTTAVALGGSAMGGTLVGQGGALNTGTTPLANGGNVEAGATASLGGSSSARSTASLGGTSSMGGATGPCAAPPAASSLVGWAAVTGNNVTTTTGGGVVTPVTVSTLAALRTAVAGTTPAVIYVTGILDAGNITVGSNKTIAGICGAEIHGHLELSGSSNVIIRNLKIVGYAVGDCTLDPAFNAAIGCSSGNDAITVQNGSHHIWFDHCDISDGTDGNLDISKASDCITVSYTKFHYTPRTDMVGSDKTGTSGHRYSNLIGGSTTEASTDKLNVTWHHNWWADNVRERQPQVRFGKVHLFNNLWTSAGDNFCVRAAYDAHVLLESNVFKSVKDPHLFYTGATANSSITADATNLYTTTTGSRETGGSGTAFTTPGYPYSPDPTDQVEALVTAEAGPK